MARAILKFVRIAPLKARLIAKQIQGMNAEYAIASLEFTPNKAAKIISKVIASAVSNSSLEPVDAIIKSARVDRGPVLKRFTPRARGSASPKHKPTAHIMIEVESVSKGDK
jgi:large subunit ribosomal protein L22